ncbi:kinase-associated lipoprotein B [Fictibacillus iocasae]|uniref:Kinase-associated lipoprotein B n=1 Tax=Fictibacillus iocasae TaxID=2715437 RepID=A0ABW2NJH0_9BACL
MTPVKAIYKTGIYVGEQEDKKNGRVLINILAVVKHPMQGDLHNPKQADVPFFQERRALSPGERTWVPEHTVKPFEGQVPDYRVSLRQALREQEEELKKIGDDFAERSLLCLSQLKRDYGLFDS